MALGRGLGSILNEVSMAYDNEMVITSPYIEYIEDIFIDKISLNPYQPRKYFEKESLEELAKSIEDYGLLQPIVVIVKDDGYLLVAGERRLRAYKLLGLDIIRAIIAEVNIDESKLRELALIENIQRENLNAMELAHSYNELLKVYKITHDELSNILYKSRSQITNTLRLLNLSKYVQEHLINGTISQGHAKILVSFDEEEQKNLLDTIVSKSLSVREAEFLVKNRKKNLNNDNSKELDYCFIKSYKGDIANRIPFNFKLKNNNSIEIKFKDKSEIENFLKMLQK